MIAFLSGKLLRKDNNSVVIETGGIGWKIFLTREALKKMPQPAREVKLWTWLHTRQDGAMELYGFLHEEERDLFGALNEVAGVGPKTALAALNGAPIQKLKASIASGDANIFSRISGIGSKASQRIILELKSKFTKESFSREALAADLDVEEILMGLGYARREAKRALAKVSPALKSTPGRLRQALKILSKKSSWTPN